MQVSFAFSIVILIGDGEGGIEMTESLLLIREYCDRLIPPEKYTKTRIVKFLLFYFVNLLFQSSKYSMEHFLLPFIQDHLPRQ